MKKITTIFFFVASLFAVQACLGNAGDEEADEPKVAAENSHHDSASEHGAPGHHESGGENGAPGHDESSGEHGAPGHHGAGAQAAHSWNAPEAEANRANPIPASEASIAKGRASFETHCVSCHGEDRTGNGPAGMALDPKPADLAMMAPMHPDGDLFWKIQTGKGAMISWKSVLSDESTWDVVNYLKNASSDDESGAEGENAHGEHTH